MKVVKLLLEAGADHVWEPIWEGKPLGEGRIATPQQDRCDVTKTFAK